MASKESQKHNPPTHLSIPIEATPDQEVNCINALVTVMTGLCKNADQEERISSWFYARYGPDPKFRIKVNP